MGTILCIKVSSPLQPATKLETEFLYNDEWTAETENNLIQKTIELLSLIRHQGRSLRLYVEVEVNHPSEAMFVIKKNLHAPPRNLQSQVNLSLREIEVLALIMKGLTNHEIAQKLFISYETVKTHRKNILSKTGTHNTASLINYYNQAFFEK